jgi:hypothetical protein
MKNLLKKLWLWIKAKFARKAKPTKPFRYIGDDPENAQIY